MRFSKSILLSLIFAASVCPASAEYVADISLEEPALQKLTSRSFSSGETIRPRLYVKGSTGPLSVMLVQKAVSLEAALPGIIVIEGPSDLEPHFFPLQVRLPEVSRTGDFELRVTKSTSDGVRILDRIALRIYTRESFEAIRTWAKDHVLTVLEEDEILARFFKQKKIRAEEVKPGMRIPDAQLVIARGDIDSKLMKASLTTLKPDTIVLVFSPQEFTIPTVMVNESSKGLRCIADERLIARIGIDLGAEFMLQDLISYALKRRCTSQMQERMQP